MYSIVKTFEQKGLAPEYPVFVRIHSGKTDGLESYWDEWNRKNIGKRRRDEVLLSAIPDMKGALEAIEHYC